MKATQLIRTKARDEHVEAEIGVENAALQTARDVHYGEIFLKKQEKF